MIVGEKLKAEREAAGLSCEQLGKAIGVNKGTISRYESEGIGSMSYLSFYKLLITLETTPEKILPDEEIELIRQSDELRGFYSRLSEKQKEIIELLRGLPPEDEVVVDVFARALSERHKE